jgi:hypothetical protein
MMRANEITGANAGWPLPPSLRYGATGQFRFAVHAI